MGLQALSTVFAQDFRDTSAAKNQRLGTIGETIDGRRYRYALAGAANLAPGKVVVAEAATANHTNIVVSSAAAIGAKQISATSGATAGAENAYADGTVVVNDATGEGIAYAIDSHAAWASAAVATINLVDQVEVALVASTSEVSLLKSPYASVIIAPGAIAHRAVGVPNVAITAAYYGWVQTVGTCSVLSDGIIAKGANAIISDAVNGALETEVAAGVNQRVGVAPEATVDTEYRAIILTIE